MGRPLLEAFKWFVCHNEMTLFFFIFSFHGRLEHFNLFALFYPQIKNKQVYSAESWPSLSAQSSATRPQRRWSPKKSLASYRKGNWANSTYISQCLGNVPLFTFRTRKSINRLVFTAAKHESKVHSLTWRKFDELLLLAATQYIYATIIAMQFIAKWKSFCFLYIALFFFHSNDPSLPPLQTFIFVSLFSFSWSVSPADIRNRLSRTSITGTPLAESCPEKKQHICQPQKYRHATSFCNNVQNPTWGSADTNYGRLLQASYSDGKFNEFLVFNMSPINYCAPPGINQIRLAVSGKPLPSPVKIADSIHTPKKAANGYLTTLSAVWAQFIQNDISYPITFAGQLKLTTFQCLPNYSMLNCY